MVSQRRHVKEKVYSVVLIADKLVKLGWRFERAILDRPAGDGGFESNHEALVMGENRYPTVVHPTGVKIALDTSSRFIHKETAVWAGDPYATDPTQITVAALWSPPLARGKGCASLAMKELCGVADELEITVSLEPQQISSYGRERALSTAQLKKWYARLGFESVGIYELLMVRKPVVAQPVV